jgi:hypothetical protein
MRRIVVTLAGAAACIGYHLPTGGNPHRADALLVTVPVAALNRAGLPSVRMYVG